MRGELTSGPSDGLRILIWHCTGCLLAAPVGGLRFAVEALADHEAQTTALAMLFVSTTAFASLGFLIFTPVLLCVLWGWLAAARLLSPVIERSTVARFLTLGALGLALPPIVWNAASLLSGDGGEPALTAKGAWLPYYYPIYLPACLTWLIGPRIVMRSLRGPLVRPAVSA